MLSAGSQSLALALDDVSWRWLVAQHCLSALGSLRLALCAGSQSLALVLDDVSWRWLVAQRCLSALSLSAGLSVLGSLRWLSALWRYAQRLALALEYVS